MEDQMKCDRLILEYPCVWLYKVIGSDPDQIRAAIAEVIQGSDCIITHSNSSESGKYHCLNLEINVFSEENRNQIYLSLVNHPDIKMIL